MNIIIVISNLMLVGILKLTLCSELQGMLSTENITIRATILANNKVQVKDSTKKKYHTPRFRERNEQSLKEDYLYKVDKDLKLTLGFIDYYFKLLEEKDSVINTSQSYSCILNRNPSQKRPISIENYTNDIPQETSLDSSLQNKKMKLERACFSCANFLNTSKYEQKKIRRLAKKTIKQIEYDLRNNLKICGQEIHLIEKFIQNYIKKDSLIIDQGFFSKCIDLIIEANDKYLYFLIKGLPSFLIKLRDNEIKIEKAQHFKIITYFLVLKRLAESTNPRYKDEDIYKMDAKSILSIDYMDDIFINILKLSKINGLYVVLYKLLVLIERRYKYNILTDTKKQLYDTFDLISGPILI